MKFYNQANYAHIPYPSANLPNATVKSGGCGVCASSNVLAFLGYDYPPEVLAPIFIEKKARVNGGTNMYKAAQIIKEITGCILTTTDSEAEMKEWLETGGIAIANVDGDTGEKGIFSSAGHFINVIGTRGDKFVVFDVYYYANKFSSSYRKQFVSVEKDKEGNVIQICNAKALNIDTKNRTPNYYLFKRKEEDKVNIDEAIKILAEKGIMETPEYWENAVSCVKYLDKLLIKIAEKIK